MTDDKHVQSKPFDALNSRGLTAKREYVQGLEQRRDAEALSLLVECLCDESWYLRDLAERAFMRLGDEGASVLLPLLEQGLWFTRTSAAGILGRMGYRPALPALCRLTEDANRTVVDAAREGLVAIGRQSGAVSLAHVLHHLPPDVRRRRVEEIAARDRSLAARIEQLMRNDDLMSADNAFALSDDSPLVRASEDGVEWEVLTSPSPPKARAGFRAGGAEGAIEPPGSGGRGGTSGV
jgi:HEAT repeat protein